MRRNNLLLMVAVLVAGIMLGGAFYSQYGGLAAFLEGPQKTGELTDSDYRMAASNKSLVIGPADIADMVARVSPAVVNIESTIRVNGREDPFFNDPFFREFFGYSIKPQPQYEKGVGTGFIITENGYVLTNYHVVKGATSLSVKVAGLSDPVNARVIGFDDQLDLAILKLSTNKKLPVLTLGNSDAIRVGEWVVAIGNPYGLDHTVTAGVISAKERPITIEGRRYKNLVQTDAAINPGNSGGPLLNTAGQVIAINTAVNVQAQGIGFAIPINTAKAVLDQLINNGKVSRPYIGVYLDDLTEDLAGYLGASSTNGALVAGVMPDSPASRCLKKGDVILSVNGKKINDSTDLSQAVSEMKVKEKIALVVLRDKKTITVNLALEEKP